MAANDKHKIKNFLKPDQVEYFGPFGMARFGNVVLMRGFLNDDQHRAFMQNAAKEYPNICKRTDQRIHKICELIQSFDPLRLLQCGYFNYFMSHADKTSEIEIDSETSIALRMIDYVQSIIASIPPTNKKDEEFSQAKWDELALEVKNLYYDLNLSFHIAHTAYLQSTDKNYDGDYDAFYVKAQMHWVNVRGNRYMLHNLPHLWNLLLPHDDIFRDLFNITIDDFIQGLERLQISLSTGLPDVTKELKEFQQKTMEALEEKLTDGVTEKDLPGLMREVIQEHGWKDWEESLFGRFLKFDLFDVQKVTGLPEKLLKELSWEPGQCKDFFAHGAYAGWPLRLMPIQVRPFLAIDGRYYCFELANLTDNLYRVIQRLIIRLRPEYKKIWNERQKVISEELPFRFFDKLFPNAKTYRSIYHQWTTGKSGELNWCETDGLILSDDHLIVIEVKAGAFTYTPPATDFPAYMASVKELLLKPAVQSKRFIEYLTSKDEVVIYDENHNPVTKLKHARFRHITSCCVTLDNFTTLAAQAGNLKPIGTDLKDFPVWSISIDDLMVYADVFDSPLMFTHFLEERKRAFTSPALTVDDELEHLSLYLKHNRYVSYAEDFYDTEPVRWHGYRTDLDKYFHDLQYSPDTAKKPAQVLPNRIKEIISTLEKNQKHGCCKVARYLLDMDGNTRDNFNAGIEQILSRQSEKRYIIPLCFLGGIKITIFCEQSGISSKDTRWKREYVLATLIRANDDERLMLTLYFDRNNKIFDADFEFLCPEDIPTDRYADIEKISKRQGGNFLKAYLKESGKRKIPRNEVCPCGSGKKYKRCCGR
ncbi:MAG: SEC-C domain-containing protein [Nitrospirae bacterium]|nr:SEC-C domain-containing protein [Nitrospirota bacterium]MDA8339167.1 SEC-C domain-containing protein [Nitrospiraceae bacterium]